MFQYAYTCFMSPHVGLAIGVYHVLRPGLVLGSLVVVFAGSYCEVVVMATLCLDMFIL